MINYGFSPRGKKILSSPGISPLLRMMKLTTLILLVFCLHLSGATRSQTVSLEVNNEPLGNVLRAIKRQTNLAVIYNDRFVNPDQRVSIHLKRTPLPEALSSLLTPLSLTYHITENTIVIAALPLRPSVTKTTEATNGPPIPQQVRQISGTVTDANNQPLEGVTVSVKDTALFTLTNREGYYQITLPQDKSTLVFTIVGFEAKELAVGQSNRLNVSLAPAVQDLDEVVVIGYGTMSQKELTSAIASVKPAEFLPGNFNNPVGMIQGKVAGLNIVKPGGADPTQGFELQLRGFTSLAGGQSPLFVIDGVIGGDLRTVNLEDIQSIDILKDGSAAAIYGTRGTNGVVIITTKRGTPGQPSVEFSVQTAVQTVAKKLENLNADEFRQALRQILPNQAEALDYGHSTDWFKAITQTPIDQYYNAAFSGGTENFSYRSSLNYRTGEGILRNNYNRRLQFNVALRQKELRNRLTVDYNISYQKSKLRYGNRAAFLNAFRYNPTEPIYDPSNTEAGGYSRNLGVFDYTNPVSLVDEAEDLGENQVTTASIKATFDIRDNWNISGFTSLLVDPYTFDYYTTRYYAPNIGRNGVATKRSGKNTQHLIEVNTNYSLYRNNHQLTVIGGYSFQEGNGENFFATNFDFDTDFYKYNNLSAGSALRNGQADMGSSRSQNRLIAFFGRSTYNYDNRYLLSLSARYEGSTRFGTNNKWGLFPAISGGWRLSEEAFLKDAEWLNELKLRAGYGITGNQDIGNYRSLQLLTVGDRFYYDGNWVNTYPPASNPNPDLKWEKKSEVNIGVDLGLWNNRVIANFDYYSRRTSDLLWTYNVPVPPNVYNTLFTNVGVMQNTGFEATVNINTVRNDRLTWNSTILFSTNSNKLVSFSDQARGYELTVLNTGYIGVDIQTWTHQITEGGPIGNFVAPRFLGIDAEGLSIFKDNNNDGVITDADREVVGNAFPDFQLSLTNQFTYRNWDLSIFLRGVFGHNILNIHRLYNENFGYFGAKNIMKSALDYPEYKGTAQYSSRYVEDGSYIKLDNLSIGYTFRFPNKVIKELRFYGVGQQLLTWTKYKGVDPEITLSGLAPGVDDWAYYPRTRTFNIGAHIKF